MMERQGSENFEQKREEIIGFLSEWGIGGIDIPSKKFPVALDGDCLTIGEREGGCKLTCADDGFSLAFNSPPILFTTISAFEVILDKEGKPHKIAMEGRFGTLAQKVNLELTKEGWVEEGF